MKLTFIYGWGPWKLVNYSSPSGHSEVTRIGLVDQEVWGWIWYLIFLQKSSIKVTNATIASKFFPR